MLIDPQTARISTKMFIKNLHVIINYFNVFVKDVTSWIESSLCAHDFALRYGNYPNNL
jgi:hypothetical protein